MSVPNWADERSKLRELFTNGEITKSTRKELEWYLVVMANTLWVPGPNPLHIPENKAFATVIRHLLQIRLGEELHRKTNRISVFALVVAIAAAVFAGLLVLVESQKSHLPNPSPPANAPVSQSLPAKLLSPAMQSPPSIALTNSQPDLTNPAAVSQPTPTNR